MNIVDAVASLISEEPGRVGEFFAAVACVEQRGRWLLGKSTANDDRKGKWCFPGGGINGAETPEQAAVRECYEETGVRCFKVGAPLTVRTKPGVAFVYCKVLGHPTIDHNHEFSDMGFFSVHEMKELDLYPNVLELIRRC